MLSVLAVFGAAGLADVEALAGLVGAVAVGGVLREVVVQLEATGCVERDGAATCPLFPIWDGCARPFAF